MGSLRWEKFARHFARRGWKLDVIARNPAEIVSRKPRRLESLPLGTRAYGVENPGLPFDRFETWLRKITLPLRESVRGIRPESQRNGVDASDELLSDLRITQTRWLGRKEIRKEATTLRGVYRTYRAWRRERQARAWADRASAIGASLALTVDFRAVVSCGPPHRAHLAGRKIAHRTGRPLVLDFRDPWSLIEGLPEETASPLRLRRAAEAEKRCVADACLIVANTELHRRALAERYPGASDRIVAVPNGFDPEDAVNNFEHPDKFWVVYAGSIYGSRDPRSFLDAAGRIVRELDLSAEDFGIEFLGYAWSHDGRSLESLAAEHGLGDHLSAPGRVPRDEALQRAARASLLLNLPQNARLCIPFKIYEYLQMNGRILALERKGSATEQLLRHTDAHVVAPDDVKGIADVLRTHYQAFARGDRSRSERPDPSLSREARAKHFLEALRDRLNHRRLS